MNVACSEFASGLGEGGVSVEDVVGLLDSVNQKVTSLKRKVRYEEFINNLISLLERSLPPSPFM